jgi:hypothetical protein
MRSFYGWNMPERPRRRYALPMEETLQKGDIMGHTEFGTLDEAYVRSLLRHAVLAPSSHNTQPWRFRITGSRIALYADRTRALPVNDPYDRELTISCGCALMNLRIAAAHEGLGVTCDIVPDPDDRDLLALVSLDRAGTASPSEAGLFPSIGERRTYRRRFESRDVPNALLQALSEAAAGEGAWFHVIEPEEKRRDVAALVAEGDALQWSDPGWRRELAAWMHPRRQGDGLALPGMIAPVAQIVVRTFDMGHGVGARDQELADASPVLAVLGTAGDGIDDWLHAGQALERVLLKAYSGGLQASYLNQPVEVASLRAKLQHLIGRAGFPQILLRLGFPPDALPAAPRRPLDDVIDT